MNNSTRGYFRGLGTVKGRPKFITDQVVLYIYIVTLVVGILGNFLVVFSIASRRRRRRKRLTANDIFILNLAISDLMLLLIFIPFSLYIHLANFQPTMFVCKCTAPIITVALGGIVYTLTAMAVVRCLVITQPFRQECTIKHATIIVVVIWVLSIALSIPKIYFAKPFRQRCLIRWQSLSQQRTYTLTLFVLRFAIPFCLMVISYIKIAIALLKTQAPRFAADSSGNIRDVTNRRENIEVIKTLVIISVLFFALMLPYRITRLMIVFGHKDILTVNFYKLTAILTIAHSCVNPIIYGTFMKNFGQDYKRFFINLFCCRLFLSHADDFTTSDRTSDGLELVEIKATSFKWKKGSAKQNDHESCIETVETDITKHNMQKQGEVCLLNG